LAIIILIATLVFFVTKEEPVEPVTPVVPVSEEEEEVEEKEEEVEEEITYNEKEETSVIPGPNEEKHEILTSVFEDVFEDSKLISNDADFEPADPEWDYWGDMQYFVPNEINTDDIEKVKTKLEEEGFEFTSMDIGTESYYYEYDFQMSGEDYSGRMVFIPSEGSINIDFQVKN
jgi:uncharacterized protein YpmB